MLKNKNYRHGKPKTAFAKGLRSNQTSGEKELWRKIRGKRFYGFKFRRQVPIGPYIVDFICVEKDLIIEIDGYTHFEEGATERDAKREDFLTKKGFTVIRFKNDTALNNIYNVLDELKRVMGISSHKPPLPTYAP